MSEPGIALSLHLMRSVSQFRVLQKLAAKYPTEDELQTALNSPEYLAMVDEVATMFDELQHTCEALSPEEQAEYLESEYPRAKTATAELASILGVDQNDLLTVLLLGWRNA